MLSERPLNKNLVDRPECRVLAASSLVRWRLTTLSGLSLYQQATLDFSVRSKHNQI
jgi:hypothetical protein